MAAKKYVTAEKKESKLQKALDAANRLIAKLKAEIAGLKQELSEYKSVRSKLRTSDLEIENAELRGKVRSSAQQSVAFLPSAQRKRSDAWRCPLMPC